MNELFFFVHLLPPSWIGLVVGGEEETFALYKKDPAWTRIKKKKKKKAVTPVEGHNE